MLITAAQLPEPPHGADRVVVTRNAVAVLDGASAFEPAGIPPGEYASRLGDAIAAALTENPEAPLASVLAEAIAATAAELGLDDGDGCPSSTVAMARLADGTLDLLALGDSYVFYGTGPGGPVTGTLTDGRLAGLRLPQQRLYRERLAAGCGYDDAHRELLRTLQRGQRRHRNRPGGYWIAAADPDAASHALILTLPATAATWAVLATDGAVNTARHLGLDDWPALASSGPAALARLLRRCQDWEQDADPDGRQFPRSKRHDDKAIASLITGRQGRGRRRGRAAGRAPVHAAHSRFRAAATLRIVSGLGSAQPEAPGFHLGTGKAGPCAPGARNGKVS